MFTDPLDLNQHVIEDLTRLQDLIRDVQRDARDRQERINRIAPVMMAARRVARAEPDSLAQLQAEIEEFDRQEKAARWR